jgi:curved DNA-binding protein CbpA
VNQGDDAKKIKVAYYKLAQKYHPDKNPGHEDKFKLMTNAYDILKNEDTKRVYDQLRDDFKNPKQSQSSSSSS